MKKFEKNRNMRTTALAAASFGFALLSTAAFAQAPGDGGPGGPPPPWAQSGPGGFGGPHGPGGPQRGGMRPNSLSSLQLAVLSDGLQLTNDQSTAIGAILSKAKSDKDALMVRPADGTRPDFTAMRAAMQKIRAIDTQADSDIKASLTADQKAMVPDLMSLLGDLQSLGIPSDVVPSLKLTSGEKTDLRAIAQNLRADMKKTFDAAQASGDFSGVREAAMKLRSDAQAKAVAVLTDSQSATLAAFKKDHPRGLGGFGGFGGPGGPGGFGGFGGGGGPRGFGGPPPPDGGPGGPPPPQ